ncbi:hypothetical protein KFK09_018427 [Dendrobium nobile]|uniref:Uncharacterized protein n=1 Tax=Dendrobium nobile TaxID=94219 RepID=A0A8T3AW18_DENNO|nr:hypothetical protein KFK09_018427 [Dendrobium nobile]
MNSATTPSDANFSFKGKLSSPFPYIVTCQQESNSRIMPIYYLPSVSATVRYRVHNDKHLQDVKP